MAITLAFIVVLLAVAALLLYGFDAGGRNRSATDLARPFESRPGPRSPFRRRRTQILDHELGPPPPEGPVSSPDPGTPAETGRRRSA
jgi:hypothetical protein